MVASRTQVGTLPLCGTLFQVGDRRMQADVIDRFAIQRFSNTLNLLPTPIITKMKPQPPKRLIIVLILPVLRIVEHSVTS